MKSCLNFDRQKAHLSLAFEPVVKFALNGGRHIDNSVRNRVAEKNVEPIPKIQKRVLSALDIVFISRFSDKLKSLKLESGRHVALLPRQIAKSMPQRVIA